jgi:hypothetical protein
MSSEMSREISSGIRVPVLSVGRGFGKLVAKSLTCVGADTRRIFVERRRESMTLDKVASVGTSRSRAAQLRR